MSLVTTTPVRTQAFYLQGKWVQEGTPVEIRSPYDGTPLAMIFQGTADHAERAIQSAVRAFGSTRRLPAFGAIFTFTIGAEETTRIPGEYLSLDWQQFTSGRWGIVRRFPLGPVAGITPFNFPLNLVAHKVAPAIASGCPIILKPAPQTPLSSFLLAEAVEQAGLPDGAFNVLPLSNEDAGLLITDDRIKMISFTGSAPVGWEIKRRAGKKKVVLELGGNAGVIVHSDADLAWAAERCVTGGFSYAGQTCISVQRIRASEWVQEAVQDGATLLCGGKRHGSTLEPTVLTGTRPDMKVNCQEIFAPVVTIESYDDFSLALRRINESAYGLQAGVFTRDANRIFEAYDELEVGGVIAGDVPSFRIDHMPYGGVKDSGLGREGLRYAIEEMTEPKLLVMNLR
ncbi:MAG: aldehyde dehydrogenase [Acidobacteria bacterium 13_1_20CM_4_56_7]|nr:MAG: aldehyde dehydrogenase [Acidobacteria bacterium 13_1_20CM_4_56_7]